MSAWAVFSLPGVLTSMWSLVLHLYFSRVLPNRYLSFSNSAGETWSILFDNEATLQSFCK